MVHIWHGPHLLKISMWSTLVKTFQCGHIGENCFNEVHIGYGPHLLGSTITFLNWVHICKGPHSLRFISYLSYNPNAILSKFGQVIIYLILCMELKFHTDSSILSLFKIPAVFLLNASIHADFYTSALCSDIPYI